MRVITIIVHLIAPCDPALHKTTEEAAHPSPTQTWCQLSFASLLLLSLEAFHPEECLPQCLDLTCLDYALFSFFCLHLTYNIYLEF